jgi:hypothetical protein
MIQEAREKAETMMHNAKTPAFNEKRLPKNKVLTETLKAKNKTEQFVIMKDLDAENEKRDPKKAEEAILRMSKKSSVLSDHDMN